MNAIFAGAVETNMHNEITKILSDELVGKYERKHLLGFCKAYDISQVVSFLLFLGSRWITGSLLF